LEAATLGVVIVLEVAIGELKVWAVRMLTAGAAAVLTLR